jgi:glycosyltransferase involved in cell wall biosynthesis
VTQLLEARSKECATDCVASVAICIGTFNQAKYLGACIESALAQNCPIESIWISDDASTDDTPESMEKICNLHPIVHYHRHPVNLGIAANLSWVLSQPSTEFIVRIDSDDLLEPDFVGTLVGLMRRYPDAGYAHGQVHEIDSLGARKRIRSLHRSAIYESAEESLKRSAKGYRVAANCILYRTEALKAADYYHRNAGWKSAEDWDLCLRIAILGWGNVYAATPVASYRVWYDDSKTRLRRMIPEIEAVTKVYKGTLEPEYLKRGWSTSSLRSNMRKRALGFAAALDSSLFTQEERVICVARLRELSNSYSLSFAILVAEEGFNPLIRSFKRAALKVKDFVKRSLRVFSVARGPSRK